jgi:hypothetical protein
MANLQITTQFGWNSQRPWLIVDGKTIAKLPKRGAYELNLPPGKHVAFVEALYLRSKDVVFDIAQDNEQVNLECGPMPLETDKFAWVIWLIILAFAGLFCVKSITNDRSFPTASDIGAFGGVIAVFAGIRQTRKIMSNPEKAYLRLLG